MKETDVCEKIEDNCGNGGDNFEPKNLIDEISSEYGYSLEVWKIIVSSYFILFIDGYNSTFFSSMIIPYTELFQLEDSQLSFLGSLFYICKGIGFLSVGFLTKHLNRIYITKSILFFLVCLGFQREISNDFNFLIFNRAITGVFVGIIEILATNVLCEFLPRKFRAFTMIIVWGGYAIGQFTPNLIMLYTMPNLETAGVSKTHFANSAINTVFFIFVFLFFKDSPRSLILHGNQQDAMEILAKMKQNISKEMQDRIISQVIENNKNSNYDSDSSVSFSELFSKEYVVFTFCALVIFFNSNFYGDGFTLISTLVLKEIIKYDENPEPGKILKDAIYMQVFNLFGNLLCGFLVEIKFLGRRRTLLILMTSIITVCISSIIFMEHIATFMSIFSLLNLIGDVMIVYTSEVYPTRIRDFGTGFINSIALSGSVISQYAFIYFFNIHFLTPFYVIVGLLLISMIAVFLIPVESHERPLDMYIPESNTQPVKQKNSPTDNIIEKEEENPLLKEK
jgi:sugar phosphate permease